jgi:hypothetical protein
MVQALVRAISVCGRLGSMADKYLDPSEIPDMPSDFDVMRSYENIEAFLKQSASSAIPQQITPLPPIMDGIISGPNAGSGYFLNNCLVLNMFASGNGFNFQGVVNTVIGVSFKERPITEVFETIKAAAGYKVDVYWQENRKFPREIYVDARSGARDITLLLDVPGRLLTS